VGELAHLIADVTESDAEIIYNPRSDSGVNRMCADLSLAREKLDYEPKISLATGLHLTLERDPRFKREATPS
jgi:nucleoside-diphosphate-sugar epimerase